MEVRSGMIKEILAESPQLMLIDGGKHGFTKRELGAAYKVAFEFLYRHGV